MTETGKEIPTDAAEFHTEPRETKTAPSFPNMTEFDNNINDLGYSRYNYPELVDREAQITGMIEGAADTALYNSGMAAITAAINTEALQKGDIVFCAEAIYGTTKTAISKVEGIKIIYFDPTDNDQLAQLVDRYHPRLIIAETVANSKEMPVTDLAKLGEIADQANSFYQENLTPGKLLDHLIRTKEYSEDVSAETKDDILRKIEEFNSGNNPFVFHQVIRKLAAETGVSSKECRREISDLVVKINNRRREKLSIIIDNTLPSPQIVNPLQIMKGTKTEKVIIESGTKHYQEGANKITLGLAYSDNAEKIKTLKERRIDQGGFLQPIAEKEIPNTLPETMPQIMENHSRNCLKLAQLVSQMPGFKAFHPNLPEHAQNELVQTLAPEGAVTLFYLDVPEGMTSRQFMERMKQLSDEKIEIFDEAVDFSPTSDPSEIEKQAQKRQLIELGSSFGHPNTWLSNYSLENTPTVRVAVGSQSEEEFEKTLDLFKAFAQELTK